MREISAVMAGVNDQLSRLNIDPTEVQGRLGALSAELEKIRSELSRTSKAQENVAQELAAVSARIASSFSPDVTLSLRSAADETLRRQEQVVSQLQRLEARVSETDQKISNLTEDILKTGDELAQTRETSRQALGSAVVASSEYIESLADAAKKLRRSIDDNS